MYLDIHAHIKYAHILHTINVIYFKHVYISFIYNFVPGLFAVDRCDHIKLFNLNI